jgi:hypothetical protein
MNPLTQRLLSCACAATWLVCMLGTLAPATPTAAQALLTGRIAARGQVLRNDGGELDPLQGKPSWVEYIDDPENPQPNDNTLQRALNRDAARNPNAVVMTPAEYNTLAGRVVVEPSDYQTVLVDTTENTP